MERGESSNAKAPPSDADNLTTSGALLVMLSRFENGEEAKKMIEDAISKLEEALVMNPLNHQALWLLGCCFAYQALLTFDLNEFNNYKDKASTCYQKALHGDPGNENYIRSWELFTKELEMNKGIHAIAFDKLSIGAASSEAKAPEMDKEFHTNVEVDKHMHSNAETDMDIHSNAETDMDIHNNEVMDKNIHSNAEMDNELCTNVEMDMDIHTNVEMDKGIHTNAEMGIDSHTKVETDKDKDIHTNTEMNMDIHINAEMDKGI